MNVPQIKEFLATIFCSPTGARAMVEVVIPSKKMLFVVVNSDEDHIATLSVRQAYWLFYNIPYEPALFWKSPVYPIPESDTEFEIEQKFEDIYFYNFIKGSKEE
jgi:hypothetical protein